MLRQLADDHFILYMLLLVVMALIAGIIGIYLIQLVLAVWEITKAMYWLISLGGA